MTILTYLRKQTVATFTEMGKDGYRERILLLKDGSKISVDIDTYKETKKYLEEQNEN